MKLGKLTLAVTLAASILMAANTKSGIDEDSIGLRKVELLSEDKAAPSETK